MQYDFGTINPATTSGVALATLLGSWRDAVNSGHSGASRPSYAVAGMIWVKMVSATAHEIYYYDGTDDVLIGTINPTANTWLAAGKFLGVVTAKTAGFTLAEGDNGTLFSCDASGGAFTIAGLASADAKAGYIFGVKKTDSSANAITFDPDSAETVDGATTDAVSNQYDMVVYVNTGAAWLRAAAFYANPARLDKAQAFTKPQRSQATETADISGAKTLDLSSYQNFNLTATADFSLDNPTLTSSHIGQKGSIRLIEDGTGGWDLISLGSYWKRVPDDDLPEMVTTAGAVCRMEYHVVATDRIEYCFNAVEA